MQRNGRFIVILAIMFALVLLATMTSGCGTQIPSGHHGVKYYKFGSGTAMGKIYPEGFQWHFPWNSFFVYQTQIQSHMEELHILSKDGASITLEVSVWYRPIIEHLDSLQVTVGPRYYAVVVMPALRGEARSIVGRYTPEQIYSSKRDEIASEMLKGVKQLVGNKFIFVENIMIRNVILPKNVSEAIDQKLAAEQDAQKMVFLLQKERQEAERKKIEADGIREFNRIVAQGLTESYLKWKGIEATKELATSPNTKVVVIGNPETGLPIILGGQK
ncbi:MAG: prohibitin family protein [candidate division Zixibacteria bacterium]|nr:prohibitin family protein [candidate division Zixibacteria bacterium]